MSFGQILGWLFVFIVGSLIVTFLVSPNSFESFKSNVKSIMPNTITGNVINEGKNQDSSIISKCKSNFDVCKSIAEQKYGNSYSISRIQEFDDEASADEFFNTWNNPSQLNYENVVFGYDRYNKKVEFPVIFIAISVKRDNRQLPWVVGCNQDGELFSDSKTIIGCG